MRDIKAQLSSTLLKLLYRTELGRYPSMICLVHMDTNTQKTIVHFETETVDHRSTTPGFIQSDGLEEKRVNTVTVIKHCTRECMCMCALCVTQRYYGTTLSSYPANQHHRPWHASLNLSLVHVQRCCRVLFFTARTRQSRHSQRSLDHDGFPSGRAYLSSVVTFVSTRIQMWVNRDNDNVPVEPPQQLTKPCWSASNQRHDCHSDLLGLTQ